MRLLSTLFNLSRRAYFREATVALKVALISYEFPQIPPWEVSEHMLFYVSRMLFGGWT